MRSVGLVLLLGLAMCCAPLVTSLEPLASALLAVGAAVAIAVIAADLSPWSITLGAGGALAFIAMREQVPLVAGAALLSAVFGARAMRARSTRMRIAHVTATMVFGAMSMAIADHYFGASLSIRAAAVVVCGVIGSIPLLVPADDAVAFALVQLAAKLPSPLQGSVLRAVALRRRIVRQADGVTRASAQKLERAWEALATLTRSRALADAHGGAMLDERIVSHVDTLHRFYVAVDERSVRIAGLDNRSLAAAEIETESAHADVAALAEVDAAGGARHPP